MLMFCLCYVFFLTIPSIVIGMLQISHIKTFAKKQAVILQPKDYAISAELLFGKLALIDH